jgi:hypothetical protein
MKQIGPGVRGAPSPFGTPGLPLDLHQRAKDSYTHLSEYAGTGARALTALECLKGANIVHFDLERFAQDVLPAISS